jgi:hypothetical protein
MASMLKALGLDPDELKGNVDSFILHMREQAATINANQARIEVKLDRILEGIRPTGSTTPILENGEPTGVYLTNEKFPQVLIDDVNRG